MNIIISKSERPEEPPDHSWLEMVPLSDPSMRSGGWGRSEVVCNEPLLSPDGRPVAFCGLWVKEETATKPRGTHKQRHRVEWR